MLAQWGEVANLNWTEIKETQSSVGDVRISITDLGNFAGYTNDPQSGPNGGDVWLGKKYFETSDFAPGSFASTVLMHELGHALGLMHPFDGDITLPKDRDTTQYTIMSYTSSTKYPVGLYPTTPMVYDIRAIQYIYGANMTTRTGSDTYKFSPSTPEIKTIWDAGGNDTIVASNFQSAVTIDLREGHYSSIGVGLKDNVGIAYGTIIEHALGGSGNDTLIGNSSNNYLYGDDGTDTAVYSGNRSNYTLTKTSTGWTVQSTFDGNDTLTGIERFKFADTAVAVDIAGTAGQAYRIYQAAFNRSPDAAGLGFWINYLDNGNTLNQAAAGFANSTEFKALYGTNPTNAEIVAKMYDNVLHRPGEAGGVNFWINELNTNTRTVAQVLAGFSESAENQAALIGVIGNGFTYTPYI